MPWSPVQRDRLGIEKMTLEKYFPDRVTWIDPTGDTKVEVRFCSNSDKEYKLRIYIPPDFPNSCPKLVVVEPKNLVQRNGRLIPSRSDHFHTLERRDGFQSICHFYPPKWTADITLYQVFMKGRLWIEAYEAHLETGKKLDHYLGHQTYTHDPSNPWIPDMEEEECLYPIRSRNQVFRLNDEVTDGNLRSPSRIHHRDGPRRSVTDGTPPQGLSLRSRTRNLEPRQLASSTPSAEIPTRRRQHATNAGISSRSHSTRQTSSPMSRETNLQCDDVCPDDFW